MPPRKPLTIAKLSDNGGQFVLTVKCACGHTRTTSPETLARFTGWDAEMHGERTPGDEARRLTLT